MFVGVSVGVFVGVFVGVSVGVFVGVSVGVTVGVFVGVSVGVFVGVSVGVFVGVSVGVLVGVSVGVFVGVSVGANMGTVTVPMAEAHPMYEIHAWEPQRVVFQQLCGNVALNHCHNVYAYNKAVSSGNGCAFIVKDVSLAIAVTSYQVDT